MAAHYKSLKMSSLMLHHLVQLNSNEKSEKPSRLATVIAERTALYKNSKSSVDPEVCLRDGKDELMELVKQEEIKQSLGFYKTFKKAFFGADAQPDTMADHIEQYKQRCGDVVVDVKGFEAAHQRWKTEVPQYKTAVGNMTAVQAVYKPPKGATTKAEAMSKVKAGVKADGMIISKLLSAVLDAIEKPA